MTVSGLRIKMRLLVAVGESRKHNLRGELISADKICN
jgi:uncharacterized protein with ACT and thioredoxin-like domain